MIKKFQIELIVLTLLLFCIFILYSFDFEIYLYFKNFNKGLNEIFLKDFFIDITILGDSYWYFFFCFFGIFIFLILEKIKLISFINIQKTKNFFIYTIICLSFNGLLTQIIKHIIGRQRPNYTTFENQLNFDFFTISSNFHSFPSGHASTVFILALILSTIIPKLKYFLLGFSSVVAFSRIVVGAHFLTDVIGGFIIAYLSFKLINLFLNYKFINLHPKKIKEINPNLFFIILSVLVLLAIFLTIGPSFDLFITSFFYKGNNQFFLQSYYTITVLFRDILLPIILIYILVLPIASKLTLIKKIFFNYSFLLKDIIFIWIIFFINLIIVINLFFKTFWGRARPEDVLQLGGKFNFSPWYQISDACASNCSFVSGDAAVGFSIIILSFVTKNIKYTYLSIIFGSLLGLIRIAEGGHFVSDIVFSAIIIYLLTFFFNKIFKSF